MNICEAICEIKKGNKVRRSCWPKEKYIYFVPSRIITYEDIDNELVRKIIDEHGGEYHVPDSILIGGEDISVKLSFINIYFAAADDLLSEDWYIK